MCLILKDPFESRKRNKIQILFLRQFVWFWGRHRPIKTSFL